MSVSTVCQLCGARLRIPNKLIGTGKPIACSRCQELIAGFGGEAGHPPADPAATLPRKPVASCLGCGRLLTLDPAEWSRIVECARCDTAFVPATGEVVRSEVPPAGGRASPESQGPSDPVEHDWASQAPPPRLTTGNGQPLPNGRSFASDDDRPDPVVAERSAPLRWYHSPVHFVLALALAIFLGSLAHSVVTYWYMRLTAAVEADKAQREIDKELKKLQRDLDKVR